MAARTRLRRGLVAAFVLVLAVVAGVALLLRVDRDGSAVAAGAPEGVPAAAPLARPAARSLAPPAPAPALPAAAPAQAPEGPAVEGRVVARETGRGVPGADVTFSRGGAAAAARTAADGSFRFEAPVEGRWLLAVVTAPGFLPFAPEWGHSPVVVDVRAGQVVRGVELRLSRATRLAGQVVDPDGKPVPGAEVRLLGARGEAALVALEDRFTTDAGGEFRFTAPRGVVVEARKAGFAPGRTEIGVRALVERRLVVRLHAAKGEVAAPARIAGRVVERGTGAPVAGALVVAERQTPSGWLAPAGQAVTGVDGRFSVDDLAAGPYRLTASAEGRARGTVAAPAGTADATIELALGGRLRGCVVDRTSGQPVTTYTVTVAERRPPGARAPPISRSFLDPSGCWALDDVAPGAATVAVGAPGFAPSPDLAVDVPGSGEAVADVRLARGSRLRGLVIDAETRAPIPGAHVALEWSSPEAGAVVAPVDEAWTDDQGRFELTGLSRRFSLEVTAAGHNVRVAGGLEVPPGDAPGPLVVAVTPTAEGEEPRREITGIGIGIAPRDGAIVVTGVMPGGGAAAAGLVQGDVIVRVDGAPVAELGFAGAANAIRGPEGTSVRLSLRRGEGTLDVWVGRGIVRG
jgi:hypothetical protein